MNMLRLLRSCFLLAFFGFLGLEGLAAFAQVEARVIQPVISVHRSASHHSETVTQAVLWERLQILETAGGWSKVAILEQLHPNKPYLGWVPRASIVSGTPEDLPQGLSLQVTAAKALATSEDGATLEVYGGTVLPALARSEQASFRVPGSAKVYTLNSEDFVWLDQWEPGSVLDHGAKWKGTHYLWGGMSSEGIDCSGFTYTIYKLEQKRIPRDAHHQADYSKKVSRSEALPGDLVFFGENLDNVTHVGVYMGGDRFMHSSSRGGVMESSLNEPYYKQRLLFIGRPHEV